MGVSGLRHCIYCGAETPGDSGRTSSGGPPGRLAFHGSDIGQGLRAWIPAGYRPYLLLFGLAAAALALLTFNLAAGPGLPWPGVWTALVAIAVIAAWRSAADVSLAPVAETRPAWPRFRIGRADAPEGHIPRTLFLATGAILILVLLIRVAAGLGAIWDIALWLASVAAFATVFVRIPNPDAVRSWLAGLAARLIAAARRRAWSMLPLLVIIVVYCAVSVPNLTAWRYAAIGDEYLFYEHAVRALESGAANPFSQDGVYHHHPAFNTIYKAILMGVFGDDHFGWKMTGIVSMVLSIGGMYVLGGLLGGRMAAIGAAGLFAASHYLLGLVHAGDNRPDAFPVMIWGLAAFAAGIQRRSPLLLYLAGASVGLGFYFHYSARIIGPVMLVTALFAVSHRDYLKLWPVWFGFALTAWPTLLLAREEIITRMLGQSVGGYSDVVTGSVSARMLSNLELNLPAFFYNETSHTYVGGALLDPVTGALALVGIALAVGALTRLGSQLCLVWILVAFAATGLIAPYPSTAVTRLFPLVAPLALLGGIAIAQLHELASVWKPRLPERAVRFAAPVALAALLVAALALNVQRSVWATHDSFHYTVEALAVAALRSEQCGNRVDSTMFVGTHPESTLGKAINSYDPVGAEARLVQYRELTADSLPTAPACIVFANVNTREAQRAIRELKEWFPSGTLYTVTTPSEKTRVEYFHMPAS